MARRVERKDYLDIFNAFKKDGHFSEVSKLLGKGSFGEVRDIYVKNKAMAGKIVRIDNNDKSGEYIAYDLRGHNIIKINKIVTKEINGSWYYLIIMEKAILRDLGKLNEYFHYRNLLKLIFNPFNEVVGDNILRFYSRQIVNALDLLHRSGYVHFDIKPENLLISISLIIKLSDFSLLKQIKDDDKVKIPGGTNGYLTLEYYKKGERLSGEDARKQDYFAFGATLFFLKYGRQMLKYKKSDDIDTIFTILSQMDKEISTIRSGQFTDQDFIDFLSKLVGYTPKTRPDFEQIYRNKWLNKNLEELHQTFWGFEYDEEKLMMEFQKNDYMIETEKIINKKPKRFKFKKHAKDIRN